MGNPTKGYRRHVARQRRQAQLKMSQAERDHLDQFAMMVAGVETKKAWYDLQPFKQQLARLKAREVLEDLGM